MSPCQRWPITGTNRAATTFYQSTGVSESANFSVMGKAADKADLRVIDPAPLKDQIVRSIYLWKTVDDSVELGYVDTAEDRLPEGRTTISRSGAIQMATMQPTLN